MKLRLFFSLFALIFALSSVKAQQAELHLVNNSSRNMYVKVMKQSIRDSYRYSTLRIAPYGNAVEYFPETGYYYLKVKSYKKGRQTIYSRGDAFKVYVGSDGYSVLTITYDVNESSYSIDPLSGERISKEEFMKD